MLMTPNNQVNDEKFFKVNIIGIALYRIIFSVKRKVTLTPVPTL